jgi:hypothetical protein
MFILFIAGFALGLISGAFILYHNLSKGGPLLDKLSAAAKKLNSK